MILADLKQEISYKWKVNNYLNKERSKALCVAYIDARDVENILDKVVGEMLWQVKFREIEIKASRYVIEASIGIKTDDGWIWKSDVGIGEGMEIEKTAYSDAFKRAGVKWGIGRFLYSGDMEKIDCVQGKPIDSNGRRIYNLTEYFNSNRSNFTRKSKTQKSNDKKQVKKDIGTEQLKKKIEVGFKKMEYQVTHKENTIKKYCGVSNLSECDEFSKLTALFEHLVEKSKEK